MTGESLDHMTYPLLMKQTKFWDSEFPWICCPLPTPTTIQVSVWLYLCTALPLRAHSKQIKPAEIWNIFIRNIAKIILLKTITLINSKSQRLNLKAILLVAYANTLEASLTPLSLSYTITPWNDIISSTFKVHRHTCKINQHTFWDVIFLPLLLKQSCPCWPYLLSGDNSLLIDSVASTPAFLQ